VEAEREEGRKIRGMGKLGIGFYAAEPWGDKGEKHDDGGR